MYKNKSDDLESKWYLAMGDALKELVITSFKLGQKVKILWGNENLTVEVLGVNDNCNVLVRLPDGTRTYLNPQVDSYEFVA